jgi:hypothetical protein
MISTGFEVSPPQADTITDYDERNFVTYLRLLDAVAEGADWREVAAIIFQINAHAEPERAKTVYETHLARARWMARAGYRQLATQR